LRIIYPADAQANDALAKWILGKIGLTAAKPYRAVGLEDDNGRLVAGVVFNGYNGANVDISFYGPGYLQRRGLRAVFSFAFLQLKATRVTARTKVDNPLHRDDLLKRMGFKYECAAADYYGPTRPGRPRAGHAMVYRLLRHECRWIGGEHGRRTGGTGPKGNGRSASRNEQGNGGHAARPQQHQPGDAVGQPHL
jgi:RimJ/RimL family protein N-acetyltransferase